MEMLCNVCEGKKVRKLQERFLYAFSTVEESRRVESRPWSQKGGVKTVESKAWSQKRGVKETESFAESEQFWRSLYFD
jgi:hypothetical protein